jgi:hypothetical protein
MTHYPIVSSSPIANSFFTPGLLVCAVKTTIYLMASWRSTESISSQASAPPRRAGRLKGWSPLLSVAAGAIVGVQFVRQKHNYSEAPDHVRHVPRFFDRERPP